MRKKLYLFLASAVVIHFLFIYAKSKPADTVVKLVSTANSTIHDRELSGGSLISTDPSQSKLLLYESLNLGKLGLSKQAFEYAVKGFNYLQSSGRLHNEQLLSVVDFSQPSSKKRLYVIDLKNGKVLFNTYVSHGRNSGREMASQFSNEPESFKSSLGFYVTGGTYTGKHGFSMRLFGEEKGINDNANSRAIVMHSAAYVSESAIRMQGFIGRSQGCPALPENLYKPIIEKIKNGTCLFLYSPNKSYASNSSIIKKNA
jgi:hypothetical protein